MNDQVNDYFDEFGRDLRRADMQGPARAPRRRWPQLAVAGAVAGVLAALVLAYAPRGGVNEARAGSVQQAQKALLSDGSILHSDVVSTVVDTADGRRSSGVATRFVAWRTTSPTRYRLISSTETDGAVTKETQSSWAKGVLTNYDPKRKTMRRLIGARAFDPAEGPLSPGRNVAAGLRKLLATGAFKDAGLQDLNGRQVRLLTGTRVLSGTAARGPDDPRPPRVVEERARVDYYIDPQTFTPVQMRETLILPDTGKLGPSTSVWDFKAFEWLPVTEENLRLLTIDPAPGTKVTTVTLKQSRAQTRDR